MAKELAKLQGERFSKAYELGDNTFRLKIGDSHLIVELPLRIGIAKYIKKEQESGRFIQKLKKTLDNQKLIKVYQQGQDRILILEFEAANLFVELFSKGNLILAEKSGKILDVFREEKWKDRILARGENYLPPPSTFAEKIEDAISEKYAIVCLMNLPLGKDYGLEMLASCKIEEKKPGTSLSKQEISCLQSKYSEILDNQKPLLFLKEGKPVDYSLFPLSKYSLLEQRVMPSLSEAMEEFYSFAPGQGKSPRMEKLERRLEEQISSLANLKEKEKEAREKGDYIHSHFQEIEQILELCKKSGIQNVAQALQSAGYKILKIEKAKKEIELDL